VTAKDSIYPRLPLLAQHVAVSYRGWQIKRTHLGPGFAERLCAAEERTYWSAERLAEFRDERLRAVVAHAAATVPYYRELFRAEGLDPAGVRSLEDLAAALPTLTKQTVQERGAEFRSEAVPAKELVIRGTGGTTGAGLRFATTLGGQQEHEAVQWRFRRWHGIQRGMWCAWFSGQLTVDPERSKPPFWRYNVPGRQVFVSLHHLRLELLGDFVDLLRRRRIPWIHGAPSAIGLLAGHLLDRGEELGYRPVAVTLAAESLLPWQAELIERGFGIRPRQRWVMTEAVAGASECEEGRLHVDDDFAAVEFLPLGDGTYRVVGTNLTNPATPLLRYELNDIVTLDPAGCTCGRGGRTLASVDGRLEDYLVLSDGTLIGAQLVMYRGVTNVAGAQVLQSVPGEVILRVIRGKGYTDADTEALLGSMRRRFGDRLAVTLEFVDSLPREGSGKVRMVVTTLPEGRLERAAALR
jgi:phenylacetate-CoA ligase